MAETFVTVGSACKKLSKKHGRNVPDWRIRRIVDSLDMDITRAGLYRLIPESMLPEISKKLEKIWSRDTANAV